MTGHFREESFGVITRRTGTDNKVQNKREKLHEETQKKRNYKTN